MILFPDCKINIGLDVLGKRTDGYHEIQTLMYPVRGLCDILEIVRSDAAGVEFSSSGIPLDCDPVNNLCIKAYELIASLYGISGVRMHLHKVVPFGAGLGGGSSDAAFTIKGLNELFSLGLDVPQMESLAARLGSDTAFFIRNTPQLSTGRGEILEPSDFRLEDYSLVIIKPPVAISTAEAYGGVVLSPDAIHLDERLKAGIASLSSTVGNAFETTLFSKYPILGTIKQALYQAGTLYASMSGSGSAMYGIFAEGCEISYGELRKMFGNILNTVSGDNDFSSKWFIYTEIIGRPETGTIYDDNLLFEKKY